MLGRQAAESGRSTSVVKYERESFFETHTHSADKEFLILDGFFLMKWVTLATTCMFETQ